MDPVFAIPVRKASLRRGFRFSGGTECEKAWVRFDSQGQGRLTGSTRRGFLWVGQRAARPFPERQPANPGERLVSFGPRSPTRAQPTQAPMAERPCAPAYVQRKERPYVLQNPLQSRGMLRGPGAACSPAGQSRSPSPQLPRNIDGVPRSNANAKSSRTTKGKALGPLLNQGLRVLGAMGSEFPRHDALS